MASDYEQSTNKGSWTPEEDDALCSAIEYYGAKNWKKIADAVPGRTDVQCLHRWQKVLNPELVKGPWSEEEDNKVRELVGLYGPRKWSFIAQHLPGRIGKQCRERWTNHLDPGVKKGNWSQWEDELIIKLQRQQGNKWAKIASHLQGRTDNAVKNRFHSTISRRMRQQARKEKLSAIKSKVSLQDDEENNMTVVNSLPITHPYHKLDDITSESQILKNVLSKPLSERNTSYSTITPLPSIHTFPVFPDSFDAESTCSYLSPTQTTINHIQFSSPKIPFAIPQSPLLSSPISAFSPLSLEKKRKQQFVDSTFITTNTLNDSPPKKSKPNSIFCSPVPSTPTRSNNKSTRLSVQRKLDLDQIDQLPDFKVLYESTFTQPPSNGNNNHKNGI
jgi:hypothetical protein